MTRGDSDAYESIFTRRNRTFIRWSFVNVFHIIPHHTTYSIAVISLLSSAFSYAVFFIHRQEEIHRQLATNAKKWLTLHSIY